MVRVVTNWACAIWRLVMPSAAISTTLCSVAVSASIPLRATRRRVAPRQARQLLTGELNEMQAIEAAQQGHRNYAKRQFTWFRREPEVRWLAGFGDDPVIQQAATELVLNCKE